MAGAPKVRVRLEGAEELQAQLEKAAREAQALVAQIRLCHETGVDLGNALKEALRMDKRLALVTQTLERLLGMVAKLDTAGLKLKVEGERPRIYTPGHVSLMSPPRRVG